jgi:hypothetical protein
MSRFTAIPLSGKFPHEEQTLVTRLQELFATCGVPLIFLTANSLANIIELLATYPAARRAINWARIFANPLVLPHHVHTEIEAIKRDGIILRR